MQEQEGKKCSKCQYYFNEDCEGIFSIDENHDCEDFSKLKEL